MLKLNQSASLQNVIRMNQSPNGRSERDDLAHPHKAWYLLPIFLGLIGGIVAFALLRKKHPRQARIALLVGTAISAGFIALVAVAANQSQGGGAGTDEDVPAAMSDEEVMRKAQVVPYGELMDDSDAHAEEIVYFEGKIVQVLDDRSEYDLRIAAFFEDSDAVWANYGTDSDKEREWLDGFDDSSDDYAVKVWGVSKGITSYSTRSGSHSVPEIDVLIIRKASDFDDDTLGKLIKPNALLIPYETIANHNKRHAGEFIQYEGRVVSAVREGLGFFTDKGSYVLRIATNADGRSDVIRSKYNPATDSDEEWLENVEGFANPFGGADRERTVRVWGVLTGVENSSGLFGGDLPVPEVDVLILERGLPEDAGSQDAEPAVEAGHGHAQPADSFVHTVSYGDIPEQLKADVDADAAELVLLDVLHEWEAANKNLSFEIVEGGADLDITWAQWMPGGGLGVYSSQSIATDDGTVKKHSIRVRLGNDDCNSNYQQYAHSTLKHVIAHEIGHYLGLRHTDDMEHLMYSGEFFNVDPLEIYDNKGYSIPIIRMPDILSMQGQSMQEQISKMHERLEVIAAERQSIRSMHGDSAGAELLLDQNTRQYNDLASQLHDLEDRLECVEGL